jgi:integrase/recombinase XerC
VSKILREWRADWLVSGRSHHTIDAYQRTLIGLFKTQPSLDDWDMATIKAWIADGGSAQIRRMRARAVNAFMKWCREEVTDASWFRPVKLPAVPETAQPTATEADYRRALAKAHTYRDRALLAVLWSSGLRRAEVARMRVEHLDLDGGTDAEPIRRSLRLVREIVDVPE